jgi:long-chain acyl-CoA synthetase
MLVADVVRAIERLGPCLAQIYGQGETPMTITVLGKADVAERDHPRWNERVASAGVASSAVEVRVLSAHGDVTNDARAFGEVVVRGDTVMRGYWENPHATAAALNDGWLRTGDIGSFDEFGYLTLKDRAKDVIISGGSNIDPREVEEVIASHPSVSEVSVIGRLDPEWGEIVVAYVVGDVSSDELDRLCTDHIARFKRPRDYVYVTTLPKNNYGKVLKRILRAADAEQAVVQSSAGDQA